MIARGLRINIGRVDVCLGWAGSGADLCAAPAIAYTGIFIKKIHFKYITSGIFAKLRDLK